MVCFCATDINRKCVRVCFRRAYVRMSASAEAFFTLKSHFTSSHALVSVCHWLLGIGDRHLSNFMIDTCTGAMVGIDFGHAFGSASQVRARGASCAFIAALPR